MGVVVEHRYTGKRKGVKRALKVCVQVNARKGDAKIRESLDTKEKSKGNT
jgi:hypothetical protein